MSRTIDAAVEALLGNTNIPIAVLARLEFDSPVGTKRYSNTGTNVYWDEDGVGGKETYVGVGNIATMSTSQESVELQSYSMQLTISGIDGQTVQDLLENQYYRNRPAYIWIALLDEDYNVVSDGAEDSGPILFFAGRMDYTDITMGEQATLTLNITSRLSDWERARGGRFNHHTQKYYVDATDRGFEYVLDLQNKSLVWGAADLRNATVPTAPGSPPGPGQRPPNRPE